MQAYGHACYSPSMPPRWTRRRALQTLGASAATVLAAPALAAPAFAQPALPDSFKALAARKGLFYGCATDTERLTDDAAFAALVEAQCSQMTSENVLKWIYTRPAPGQFDFRRADILYDWCAWRGIRLYGSCLVWHEAMPPWLAPMLNRSNAARLLEEHISTTVGRYRGRIPAWDVAIETLERLDGRPDGLRRSPWLEALGEGYLPLAYQIAHAADPAARLAISDYALEYDDIDWMVLKRGDLLRLIERMKAQGAPIHVLNLQSHLLGDHPPAFGAGLKSFLREAADLGLDIVIGELDVDDQKETTGAAERDRVAADNYRRYLDVVLQEPKVRSVTIWGLSDRYNSKTYVSPRPDHDERPLPFDRELRPKPAAFAVAQALAAAPAGIRPPLPGPR